MSKIRVNVRSLKHKGSQAQRPTQRRRSENSLERTLSRHDSSVDRSRGLSLDFDDDEEEQEVHLLQKNHRGQQSVGSDNNLTTSTVGPSEKDPAVKQLGRKYSLSRRGKGILDMAMAKEEDDAPAKPSDRRTEKGLVGKVSRRVSVSRRDSFSGGKGLSLDPAVVNEENENVVTRRPSRWERGFVGACMCVFVIHSREGGLS